MSAFLSGHFAIRAKEQHHRKVDKTAPVPETASAQKHLTYGLFARFRPAARHASGATIARTCPERQRAHKVSRRPRKTLTRGLRCNASDRQPCCARIIRRLAALP